MLNKQLVQLASTLSVMTAIFGLGQHVQPVMANPPQSVLNANTSKAKQLEESALNKTEQNDFAGAIVDYTAALKLDPQNTDLYVSRAYLQQTIGDNKAAITGLDQAIKINPKALGLHTTRAASYITIGNYKGAVADLTTEMKLNPTAELYVFRGRAYQSLGDHKQAIADFTEQLELKDDVNIANSGLVLVDRANSYLKLGNKKAAIQDLKAAIAVFRKQLGPDSANEQSALEQLKALE